MRQPQENGMPFREVLLAEQFDRIMRSNEAVLEFEDLRFRLSKLLQITLIEQIPAYQRQHSRGLALLCWHSEG